MADNLHHQLCSAACKEQSRLDNLAERKNNETVSAVDKICNAASAYWYNRLKLLKRSPKCSSDDIQKYENEKNHFLKEKCNMRKSLKEEKITFTEFRDWLLHQEVVADEIYKSRMVTKR